MVRNKVPFTFTLDFEVLRELREVTKKKKTSMSSLVNEILKQHLEGQVNETTKISTT